MLSDLEVLNMSQYYMDGEDDNADPPSFQQGGQRGAFKQQQQQEPPRPPPMMFRPTSLQDDIRGMTRVSSSVESILVAGDQQTQQDNRALAKQDFETYTSHALVPYAV